MNKKGKQRSTNRRVRICALVLAVLVCLFSGVVGGILKRGEIPAQEQGNGAVTLLVIGTDNRKGDKTGRSDTILLVSVNQAQEKCAVVSVLRDLYVAIPNHGENRINAAYSFGGPELLRRTVEENLQISVDGIVQVDFSAFKTMVDAAGGVDISLTAEEAEYLRGEGPNCVGGKVGRYTNGRTYDVQQGDNTNMDGEMALDYVRARHVGASSDFGRTNRQRKMLKALLKKTKSSSLPNLISLYKGMKRVLKEGHASSDLRWEQLAGIGLYVLDMAQKNAKDEEREWLVTGSIPEQGQYLDEKRSGMAVLVPKDWSKLREGLYEKLSG